MASTAQTVSWMWPPAAEVAAAAEPCDPLTSNSILPHCSGCGIHSTMGPSCLLLEVRRLCAPAVWTPHSVGYAVGSGTPGHSPAACLLHMATGGQLGSLPLRNWSRVVCYTDLKSYSLQLCCYSLCLRCKIRVLCVFVLIFKYRLDKILKWFAKLICFEAESTHH